MASVLALAEVPCPLRRARPRPRDGCVRRQRLDVIDVARGTFLAVEDRDDEAADAVNLYRLGQQVIDFVEELFPG